MSAARSRPSWELLAVGAILALYVLANVLVVRARPAMTRAAVASVDSVLERDRWLLDRELLEWREGLIDDGRWLATVVGVVLDSHAPASARAISAADEARLRTLTLAQLPGARVWVVDARGRVRASVGDGEPVERHRQLARMSLERDSALLAASEVRDRDLRLAVASPVRAAAGRGLAVVLDVSAANRLRRHLPNLAWEGHAGRAALTFPWDATFVGATWTADSSEPRIGWPAGGWSLTDSSLIVVGGALSDATPRFELGVPRAAALSIVETRAARLHAAAAMIALPLCLGVLLAGRAARDRRLRRTETSLAESRLRTAQAETAATRAGLAAVQARLNPHFLSNALHSVAALIGSDPEAAEETLDRLGDLFRYSLEHSERGAVLLEDEWRFVRDYLAIEQMRLGRRLVVEMELDPEAGACVVPSLVLQPLVENAVRHGIGPRREGGTVRVSARRVADRLDLLVADDGMGAAPAAVDASAGTGLRTLRQRLALDRTFEGRVDVDTAAGEGFRVRVTLRVDGSAAARMPVHASPAGARAESRPRFSTPSGGDPTIS